MLTDERNEALKIVKALNEGTAAQIEALMQDEHDWALFGGIASGIAGGAAGVATAMDMQAKNAQIRAQNEATRQKYLPLKEYRYKQSIPYKKKADELGEEIEKTKTKFVQEDDGKLFSKLKIAKVDVKQSSTGTCTVTAHMSADGRSIKAFGEPAVIDGSLNADIYDGDKLIGTASLLLPKNGVKGTIDAIGMCLFCKKAENGLSAQLSSRELWTIEK